MVNHYDISYDEKLDIYTVRNKKKGVTYTLIVNKKDGGFNHTCKAILVRGRDYQCRHKDMVMKKYFAGEKLKSKFNLTRKKE